MTTEFELSPAQSGIIDEKGLQVVGWDQEEEGGTIIATGPEGLILITAEGELKEAPEPERPEPEEILDVSEATPEEIEAAKPAVIDLMVDPKDPNSVFRVMDRADEILILDELQERALDTFVYSFESGGKRLTDLTVAGVNESVRLMNQRGGTQIGVSDQPPVVEHFQREDEKYIRVLVFAADARQPGSGRWGTAVEPERAYGKWDKFAFTKALNKAQRNALKMQIPEDFRQTLIAQYLGTHHMQELKALDPRQGLGAGAIAELPPALDDDEAKAIKKEIHDRFNTLQKMNRLKCPPAKLNIYLAKAETESHERMRLLVKTFDQWILEEEEAIAKRAENQAAAQ